MHNSTYLGKKNETLHKKGVKPLQSKKNQHKNKKITTHFRDVCSAVWFGLVFRLKVIRNHKIKKHVGWFGSVDF